MRTWSELNKEILKAKEANQARAWMALRFLDIGNKGCVPRNKITTELPSILCLGTKQISNLVSLSNPNWVQNSGEILMLQSQLKVASRLNTKLGMAVDIPVATLCNYAMFKAYLFSSWVATSPEGKTISLDKLCSLFGTGKNTIRRWIQLSEMRKELQFSYVEKIDENTYVPTHVIEKGLSIVMNNKQGEECIAWQRPNRYFSPLLTAEKKQWQNNKTGRLYTETEAKPKIVRLFYDTKSGYEKSKRAETKGDNSYVFKRKSKSGNRWYKQEVT